MVYQRPYRKRVSVAQPPRPPEGATLEQLQVWQRDVWEPWDEQRHARVEGQALTPRETGRDRRAAELRAALVDEMTARIAADAGRSLAERGVPELRLADILARHGR